MMQNLQQASVSVPRNQRRVPLCTRGPPDDLTKFKD